VESPFVALADYAFLVAWVLDQLGYKQVDVLGFSYGCGLAQQFAFQHAKLCRRLILSINCLLTIITNKNTQDYIKRMHDFLTNKHSIFHHIWKYCTIYNKAIAKEPWDETKRPEGFLYQLYQH